MKCYAKSSENLIVQLANLPPKPPFLSKSFHLFSCTGKTHYLCISSAKNKEQNKTFLPFNFQNIGRQLVHRYRTGQRSKRHGRFGALLARQHGVGDALQRAEMRNVRLNFRQQERSHLMENMIYNDLIRRGYSVDVGIVELTRIIEGRRRSSQYKIDFVVNVGNDKLYIQSALHVDTPEKKAQETFSLRNTGDFFRKIVVLDGNSKPWTDEDGVMYVGVIPFLLEDIVAEAIG